MADVEYTAPSLTTNITLTDIAWLAGILEGEAAFQWQDSPKIAVQMTDKDVIERLATVLGMPEITVENRRTTTGNQVFGVYVFGSRAAAWMMTLYPCMSERRQRKIAEILRRWLSKTGFPRGRKGELLPALCHPERPRQGKGLCAECYQKEYLKTYVQESKATCHPERLNHGYGLCPMCYLRERRHQRAGKASLLDGLKPSPQVNTCHPERPHFGKGLCASCYMKQWRADKTATEHPCETTAANFRIPRTPQPSALRTPYRSDAQIAWFAGLLEGEGSFLLRSSPTLKITMTDKDVMERVAHLCDWHLTSYQPKGKASYKRAYQLQIHGSNALGWLRDIYPFMGQRRQQQIDLILSQWRYEYVP